METIQYSELIKDTITLNLNTQSDCCIPLNGTMKSKAFYDLKNYIDFDTDDSIEYVTMSLPYAVICNSNYIFYSGNSTIQLTYNSNTYAYTVPFGNYNVNTFMAYLGTIFPVGMTVSFSSITNKFTFAYTLAGGQSWGFSAGTTCDYNMGFVGSLLTTGANITAPFSVDFLPIDRYILHCNVLSNGLMLTTNSAVASTDILASIPNSARLNSQIVYNGTGTEYLIRSIGNNGIVLTITNDNNQEIDFNNVSSYFVLQFNVYRRMLKRPQRFSKLVETVNSRKPELPKDVILEQD
jgi:hypothetical protein